MRKRVTAGAIAGLVAGVVFGLMMQMMSAPGPDGSRMPMMTMVAQVVGSSSMVVGWTYHLFNSAVIGAAFGLLLGGRVGASAGRGAALGAGYGVLWWILGALILMPLSLGMTPLAPLRMEPMRPVAMGSLVGHIVYGVMLGLSLARLLARAHAPLLHARRHA
jgi:uncharacterized membrane protein YagU involved in acid resistance